MRIIGGLMESKLKEIWDNEVLTLHGEIVKINMKLAGAKSKFLTQVYMTAFEGTYLIAVVEIDPDNPDWRSPLCVTLPPMNYKSAMLWADSYLSHIIKTGNSVKLDS